MTIAVTSPVTGSAQTGFTAPTYTNVPDVAPDANGKQYAVTALGGTQAGVRTHSASDPFSITFWKPKVMKALGIPNPSTGFYPSVGKNVYKVHVRKGVNIAANQAPQLMLITCEIAVPAGSDNYDSANVRAALSLLIGALTQQSAGLGDSASTGIF